MATYPNETIIEDRSYNAARTEYQGQRTNQFIWYVAGVINALLALRIIFLALGARETGFTSFLYSLTAPLSAPFRGIFPAPIVEGAYFDTASLVAIIIYSLIAWGIQSLIDVTTTRHVPL